MLKYLKTKTNKIMLASFITILLCNVIALLFEKDIISEKTAFWCTVFGLGISLLSLFLRNENTKATGKNNVEFENSDQFIGLINIRKTNPYCKGILEREQHRKDLLKEVNKLFAYESYPKGLVLTGESGAGKSILLRLFCRDLKKAGYVVYLNEAYNGIYEEEETDDYIIGLPKRIEKDKKYVLICDQFEGYLQHDVVEQWIKDNKDVFNNCVFLFSFPQKFLTEIYTKIFRVFNHFYLQTYVLYLNDEDEEKYWGKIEKTTLQSNLKDTWQNTNSPIAHVLAQELRKVKSGEAPLIELEFLGKMLQDNIGGSSVTIDNFIELRFNEWVDKFDNRETAYAILTLFTSFDSYRIKDIKLVTFESEENFNSIYKIFYDTDFLSRYLGGFSAADATNDDSSFMPTHEYVSREIQKYLASMEVPVGVKCYTEYYRNNKDNSEYIEKVSANYKKYDKKHLGLRAMLYIMLAILVIFNFFEVFSQIDTQENTWHRIGFTIISFFSVFYIYNYCDLIMWARSRRASIFVATVGFITIIYSYMQPLGWGIALGIEILFLGISIGLALCRGTEIKAYENLKKDTIMFSGIGGTILFLGIVYISYFSITLDYTWQYVLLRVSYYLLFSVYAGMSSYNHIKSDYIMNKIGYINMLDVSKK